jgi:GT2 family glycosyltransferase
MTCFGMVTTAKSRRYTLPALESFLRNTVLDPGDHILLIDNDGDFDLPSSFRRVELIHRQSPASFAANVNLAIGQATEQKCDVVFLNNDMIFTWGWLDPLCVTDQTVLIPMCNQHIVYRQDGLQLRTTMIWEDYAGHEDALEKIAQNHRNNPKISEPYWRPPRISFYCFRLPWAVHAALGPFDEGFGVGGGEDVDYRLRAYAAGFDTAIATRSYVLHFMGKSTWDSGETQKETRARDAVYMEYFRAKWGDDLARLFLFRNDSAQHAAMLGVDAMMRAGDYRGVIAHCLARRAT